MKKKLTGYFITYTYQYNDGTANSAIAVVGDSFKSIAMEIMADFGLYEEEVDIEVESLSSIEELMVKIGDCCEEDTSATFSDFEYKYVEMTPIKHVESFDSVGNILYIGEVIDMGRMIFSDFDSKILKLKS